MALRRLHRPAPMPPSSSHAVRCGPPPTHRNHCLTLARSPGIEKAVRQAGRETSSGHQNITARGAACRRGPSNSTSTGLVQAAPAQAPVRLTSPALADGRHFSLVSWPWPTPPAFNLRILKFAPVSCSPLRPSPTHQKHCLTLARSPSNGPPAQVAKRRRSGAGMRDRPELRSSLRCGAWTPALLPT